MRIYLAGPDVFHPDALTIAAAKKALLSDLGLTGVFPFDATVEGAGLSPRAHGLAIARKDMGLAQSCDGALINITPYLGPAMDTGTAVELGLMAGLGRPLMGYSCAAADFETRAKGAHPGPEWLVERFGLADNLMVEGVIAASGGQVMRPATDLPFTALETFAAAARALADLLTGG